MGYISDNQKVSYKPTDLNKLIIKLLQKKILNYLHNAVTLKNIITFAFVFKNNLIIKKCKIRIHFI